MAQLLGLNSAGELKVGEFTTQQLWFQEAKQLKTLALSFWGEFPRHWNDFTIPDNDGSAVTCIGHVHLA